MAEFISGQIIYQGVLSEEGLTESSVPFSSLSDLFKIISDTQAPHLIDRIFVTGKDSNGREQTINFVFQTIKFAPKE